ETAALLYDAIDFQRATELYLWALPLVTFANWRVEQDATLRTASTDLVKYHTFAGLVNVLTASATIPYTVGFIDVREGGPVVLRVPPPPAAVGFFDLWQRPIHDPEMDQRDPAAGPAYMIVGPGQEVDDTDGFTVLRSRTFTLRYSLHALASTPAHAAELLA